MHLSPEERAQFVRELPLFVLLLVLLFVIVSAMLAVVPPVAVQS